MTMNRDQTFSGWCCTDCLFLLANGDAPADWTPAEITEWQARIAHYTEGCEVTLGMFREGHDCRSNWTVTYLVPHRVRGSMVRGTVEVLAGSYADAMEAAHWEIPAGARLTVARGHELETESDRGGDCECEQLTFTWSACDVCGSNLGGSRDAVVFWFQPEPASTDEADIARMEADGAGLYAAGVS
jgi:hypothetical protein